MQPTTEEKAIQTNAGMETPTESLNRAQAMLEPTVSANELIKPRQPIQVPTPKVSTNDGSQLNNLIGNTNNNIQNYITSQSEEAVRAREIADFIGEQQFDGAGQREQLNQQYKVPENLARLQDIQTQLAKSNTASELRQSRIAGAAGQTYNQGQSEITQEQREQSIRDAGIAAEANILQGNIETAATLVNQAMTDYYSDRQLNNQNMITQLEYLSGIADEQTSQLLTQEARDYQEDQNAITRAQSLVDNAVSSGYLSGNELQSVLSITDPTAQAEMAQAVIARGIQRQIAEAKAAAASGGSDTPDVKNFGTADAPIWRQWNASTGEWQEVSGIEGQQATEQVQQTLDQMSFLRDTVSRIVGGEDPLTGGKYDALYKAAGPNPTVQFLRRNIGSSATDFSRLVAQVDTLKTNALTLMADPNVKKFFGPQMSNNDVRLMSSAATTLRPEDQTPEEVKAEALRYDDLFNRMQTAVKNGLAGNPVQGPVQSMNIITAPDGLQIEIID